MDIRQLIRDAIAESAGWETEPKLWDDGADAVLSRLEERGIECVLRTQKSATPERPMRWVVPIEPNIFGLPPSGEIYIPSEIDRQAIIAYLPNPLATANDCRAAAAALLGAAKEIERLHAQGTVEADNLEAAHSGWEPK